MPCVSEPVSAHGGGAAADDPAWGAGPVPCLAQGSCLLEAAPAWSPALALEEDSGAWDHQAQQSVLSASFPQQALAWLALHRRELVNRSL